MPAVDSTGATFRMPLGRDRGPAMQVFYSDTFELPLPEGHQFPAEKYQRVREWLQASSLSRELDFKLPPAATDQQLLRVHTTEYLEKLKSGALSRIEQRRIGFPWSPEMVERHRRSAGATLAASRAALRDGAGVHLAGGTHHGFPDHGEGFCVFNDVAVSVRNLQAEGLINRAVVIDLDVRQGNGTAAIFADDPEVFTFSMHGERNFPQVKEGSDIDIMLPDGTTDARYLAELTTALAEKLPFDRDLAFFLAGADCYGGDRYGRLKLTKAGIAERDRLVFEACRQQGLPVTVVMAGGYSKRIEDIVDINVATIRTLLATMGGSGGEPDGTDSDRLCRLRGSSRNS